MKYLRLCSHRATILLCLLALFLIVSCTSAGGVVGAGTGPAPRESATPLRETYIAPHTPVAPIIDGRPDDIAWECAPWAPIDQIWIGRPATPDDFTGHYKVLWTAERLHVLIRTRRSQINDRYPDEFGDIYNYDCAEIFIDEDDSKSDHSGNFSAFAYHMTTTGHSYQHGPRGGPHKDFTDHVELVWAPANDDPGNDLYYWEAAVTVYDDSFRYGKANTPVVLQAGKRMGFCVAYNTNNGGRQRRNMFGSTHIPGADKNIAWYHSRVFGLLVLGEEGNE